jgi:MFS family permease
MSFPSSDSGSRHDPYAAFRLGAFRRYFTAHTLLIFGYQMQKVAIGWEMYERTDSPLVLGYVGLVHFAPLALLAVFAGHVTDVYNRKRILLISVAVNAVSALGLAWNSLDGDNYVRNAFLLLLLSGCARAFQQPARRSFLPRIVPREVFPNAVSWHSSGFELSSMGGPALGGALIAVFGSATPIYLINASGLVLFFLLVAGIPYVHEKVADRKLNLESILAGFRFIRRTPVVFAAITLDMLGVLLGGAVALMPVFARDILEVGPTGLGWLMAAPAVGAFSMAILQAHTKPARRSGRRLIFAVSGFGLATIVFGLSTSFPLSFAMLYLLGVCDNISVVIRGVLVQMLTPDAMRGRVSAIDGLFIGTSNELGAFESGAVAALFGPVFSVVSGGIGTIAVVLGAAWIWPELRRYGALDQDTGES